MYVDFSWLDNLADEIVHGMQRKIVHSWQHNIVHAC